MPGWCLIQAMTQRMGQVTFLVLHRHYPPRVLVFYPLYKYFRHRLRIPMALSILAVWIASAFLHGIPAGTVVGPAAGLAFFTIFTGLGVLSAVVVLTTKSPRASRVRFSRADRA